MDSEVKVTINYNCAADDSKRDGLKGYFTKTDITMSYNDISTISIFASVKKVQKQLKTYQHAKQQEKFQRTKDFHRN